MVRRDTENIVVEDGAETYRGIPIDEGWRGGRYYIGDYIDRRW